MAAGRMTTNPAALSNTDSFLSVSGGPLGAPGNSLFPHLVQLLVPGAPITPTSPWVDASLLYL